MSNMKRNESSLASLMSYGGEGEESSSGEEDDSKQENYQISDEEEESKSSEPLKQEKREASTTSKNLPMRRRAIKKLVSYGADEDENEEEKSDEFNKAAIIVDYDLSFSSEMDTSTMPHFRPVRHHSTDEVQLPPVPPGKCSKKLQDKITNFYEQVHQRGNDLNAKIQGSKDFRNPSIYEKLIQFCGIDEKGTNYPLELYDPTIWGPESFYDELAKTQKTEMDKREKERKTKIEFMHGTKKADGTFGDQKRKSKWDTHPAGHGLMTAGLKPPTLATAVLKPAPIITIGTTASGSKSTIIPSIGTLPKTKK